MTDREKLIELLKEANAETAAKIERGEIEDAKIGWEFFADHLLANGVVVREKGENLNADTPSLFECSKCWWCCWDTYTSDTGKFNFCPNCGADMRKGENG